MYGDLGEEVLTRVDYDRKLFIISHRCQGRHAVVAALTMMLSAWQHERGTEAMDFAQLNLAASVMERFIVDMGLQDAAAQRLSSGPPPTPIKPKAHWRVARRSALAAALLGSIAAAWWANSVRQTASDPADALQTAAAIGPVPTLAQDKQLTTAPFSNTLGLTAAHPIDPAFAAVSTDQHILRINLDGTTHPLTKTQAPIIWLSLSPNGQYLAACDIAKNIYLVPWDSDQPTQQWTAEGTTPLMVWVDNAGLITWQGDQSKLFITDTTTQTTTRLLGQEQAINPSGDGTVMCIVSHASPNRTLSIQNNGRNLPLTTQLLPNQLIHDADASDNHQTIAVLLNDGLLLIFQDLGDGRYRMREYQFPAPFGTAQIQLSQDGRTALIVTDQAYRFDLQRLRVTAAVDLPPTGGPVYDLAWREELGEIAIARAKEGLLWHD